MAIKRYGLYENPLVQCYDGRLLLREDVVKYLGGLLKHYESKALIYRADTIQKIIKDLE